MPQNQCQSPESPCCHGRAFPSRLVPKCGSCEARPTHQECLGFREIRGTHNKVADEQWVTSHIDFDPLFLVPGALRHLCFCIRAERGFGPQYGARGAEWTNRYDSTLYHQYHLFQAVVKKYLGVFSYIISKMCIFANYLLIHLSRNSEMPQLSPTAFVSMFKVNACQWLRVLGSCSRFCVCRSRLWLVAWWRQAIN